MHDKHYTAFMSYAHDDEAIAARLHSALETYRIPKALRRPDLQSLSPIFRDTAELTAHYSLSEKIKAAVMNSRFLIVLCSPASKASHWVNEEIRLFRELHGEASILCVLLSGTPDTSFPPALLEGGREPLAANLGTTKERFRLGTIQIAASILGVGLDDLVQRDAYRRRRLLQSVTLGAVIFSSAMGMTALTAVSANNEAQANRLEAEGLVEYMITDLQKELKPLGKLDILDGVGDEVVAYYDRQDQSKLPDDSLSRQARTRHILGQVALDADDMEKAEVEILAATRLTEELLARNPDSTDAIFTHAQSEYYLGRLYSFQQKYDKTRVHWERYDNLAKSLFETDNKNLNYAIEAAFGANNMALLEERIGRLDVAERLYDEAVNRFRAAEMIAPEHAYIKKELGNALGGAANIAVKKVNYSKAKILRNEQIDAFNRALVLDSDNKNVEYRLTQAFTQSLLIDFQQNPNMCDIDGVDDILRQYRDFVAYDPNNLSWRQDYYYFWHKAILACFDSYPKEIAIKSGQDFLLETKQMPTERDWSIKRREVLALLE